MEMGYAVNWTDLPEDLVINVAHRLSFLEEFLQFTAVCKSWKSATEAHKPMWLPTRCPMLLLAEEVAPGAISFNCEYSDTDEDEDEGEDEDEDEDGDEEEDDEDEDEDGDEEEDDEEEEEDAVADDGSEKDHATQFFEQRAQYIHSRNSIGSTRGLYSLLLMKTYNIELPEAAGRLILGTNKGWLVTLGRDLQINLLHPLLRYQFSLPPMLTFPRQYDEYHEHHTPEEASEQFIRKVAMSSKLLNKNTDVSSFHHHATPSPIVMSVYGSSGFLGFARLGDKSWTDVNVPSRSFKDIVYHKGNFYAVDSHGDVYLCCIDDCKGRGGPRGTKIASLDTDDWDPKYLVESLSGSDLFLIVRNIQFKHFREPLGIEAKYRTTYFSVWRLHLKYDSLEIPSCTLTKENNLGDVAIFVGRASSLSVSSSEIIKPNSIYFTDDNLELFIRSGGGHDMGIFDMERRTIEPHFPGKSIHPISPPLWCI